MVKKFIDKKELVKSLLMSLIVISIFFLMATNLLTQLSVVKQIILYVLVVIAMYVGSFIKIRG